MNPSQKYTQEYLAALASVAKSHRRIQKLKGLLAAISVGLLMSSPLWMQAIFCLFFGECR